MSLLLDATLETSLIILVALAATRLLRRRSAAMRHWLMAAAIACAAAIPLLKPVAPAWRARVGLESLVARVEWPQRLAGVTEIDVRPGPQQGARSVSHGHTRVDPARAASPPSTLLSIQAMRAIYLTGVALNLCLLLVGLGRLAWLASHTRRLRHGPWADMARDIAHEYGLRRPIQLLHSDHPWLLMTWGFFRPKVLLPASAGDWSSRRTRSILGHELAHIRRGDWAIQIGAELLRCVYWFNPLLWIACRRLRFEGERACDDVVLSAGIDGSTYATDVLDLARDRGRYRGVSSPALAMASRSGLERRINAMLNTQLDRTPVTRSARLAIALVWSLVALPIAGLGATQPSSTRFSGWIVDPSGIAVADAAISVTDVQTRASHQTASDTRGHFEYTDLPPGDYLVEVRASGFAPRQDAMKIEAREQTQRNIRLQLGSVRETVVVSSGASPVVTADDNTGAAAEAFVSRHRGQPLQPPIKVRHVRPVYEQRLEGAGVYGSVTLEGRIGTDGALTDLEVVPPANPDLTRAALDAVRQWRYEPTRLHGVPVETNISITVDFLAGR
jgi:TonB family protein